MTRLFMPILAALTAAMTLSSLAASAQNQSLLASSSSANAPAAIEIASANMPANSSSSSSALFATPAQSSITIQAAPVVNRRETGARPFSGMAMAVKFGVAGVGFDIATPLVMRHLNLRGGASFLSYTPSTITTDNVNINGNIKFQNAAVMADWFPFHGWFRLSGGATTYNNTGLNAALAVPTGQSFTLGGTTYYSQPGNPVTGTGVFAFGGNKVAPRVTIGTGNMLPEKGHFRFVSELGFQYFSQPTVVYNISGNGCTGFIGGVYTNCGPIPQDSITSEQNKLQNDLNVLRFFPILSLGLSYRIH
jgi:hypothetical protein